MPRPRATINVAIGLANIPAVLSLTTTTFMKASNGPTARSIVPLPATANTIKEYVASIRGAATIIALPIPDAETKLGPRITAVPKSTAVKTIGTSK